MATKNNPYKLPKVRAVTWDITQQGSYCDGVLIGKTMAMELLKRVRDVGDATFAQRLVGDLISATASAWDAVGGDAMAQKHVTEQTEAFQVVQGARVGLFSVLGNVLLAHATANASLLDGLDKNDFEAVFRHRPVVRSVSPRELGLQTNS